MATQNLVDANMDRAILIASACASRLDRAGIQSAWSGYDPSEGLVGELRTDTLIQYMRPKSIVDGENYTRLFFHNPRLTDIETVDWGEEVPIQQDITERFTEPIKKIKGIAYENTIEHTFSKTTTLQEAFKVGAELAVKAFFKASYSGVEGGAEVSAKLTAEYSRAWSSSETRTDTESRHISLPADYEGEVTYEAIRSVDKVQRHIKAVSNMDYKIEIVSGPKPEPVHATWETLDEFLSVATGFASSTHPLYQEFIGNGITSDESDAIRKAGEQDVEFSAEYENVQKQEIRIV